MTRYSHTKIHSGFFLFGSLTIGPAPQGFAPVPKLVNNTILKYNISLQFFEREQASVPAQKQTNFTSLYWNMSVQTECQVIVYPIWFGVSSLSPSSHNYVFNRVIAPFNIAMMFKATHYVMKKLSNKHKMKHNRDILLFKQIKNQALLHIPTHWQIYHWQRVRLKTQVFNIMTSNHGRKASSHLTKSSEEKRSQLGHALISDYNVLFNGTKNNRKELLMRKFYIPCEEYWLSTGHQIFYKEISY